MGVLWDAGEHTWEPLNIIKADDPVTVAQYVKVKNFPMINHIGNGQQISQKLRIFLGIVDRYV